MKILTVVEVICSIGLIYSAFQARDAKKRKKFSILTAVFFLILVPVTAFKAIKGFSRKDRAKLCEQKDVEVCVYLAIKNRDQGNVSKAIDFFKRACEYGDLASCIDASYHLSKNSQSEEDQKESLAYAMKACHKGEHLGCFNVACSYCYFKDPESSLIYFEKSFVMGYRNWKNIETDKAIDCIRKMEGFQRILAKKPN